MTKTSEILPIKKKVGRPAKNLNGKTVRQIVLDEARKLVSQHGTDSLSFDRLSKETGIAKGTILYQFKRKEDLLLALLQAHASELEAKFKTAEKKSIQSPRKLIPFVPLLSSGAKNSSTVNPRNQHLD